VALGSQVVNLIRLNIVDQIRHLAGDREVAVVQVELGARGMGILTDMINTISIKGA